MKIKLNGEYTEDELIKLIEENKKPKWEIKYGEDNAIELHKNGRYMGTLIKSGQCIYDFHNLVFTVAIHMGYSMPLKDKFNKYVMGFGAFLDLDKLSCIKWILNYTLDYAIDKTIDTKEHAEEIVKMLNDSKDLKDWIERM